MKISEIKQNARNYLKENYWTVLSLCALYLVIVFFIGAVSGVVGKISYIGNILLIAITVCVLVPLSYGFTKNLLDLKYGKTTNVTELFDGGFGNFERAISTWWSTTWRKFLKTLPGNIIMGAGLTVILLISIVLIAIGAYYSPDTQELLKESLGSEYDEFVENCEVISDFILSNGDSLVVIIVASFGVMIIGWLITLPFLLQYVIYDIIAVDRTDLNGAEVAEESVRLMKGNRLNYIGFLLSFIGWYILCFITCGLGFIFLMPYVQTARVSFYESLIGNDTQVVEKEQETVVEQ